MKHLLKILVGITLLFLASMVYASPVKDWTLLIYINGNNNLHKSAVKNILDMEQVGSTDKVNVVVQWANKTSDKTVRMLIEKSTNPNEITSPILDHMKYVDMGDYVTLKDFIRWGIANFPAKHYFIEVWDHGDGWHAPEVPMAMNLDISRDDFTHHMINTTELGGVMKYAAQLIGHKVDIYGSDACLMAMAEVANEMSESVDLFVGSEETVPSSGWPYKDFLSSLEANSEASASDISKLLVDKYLDAQADKKKITLSVFDLNKFPDFYKSVAVLVQNIRQLDSEDKAKVLQVMKTVGRFDFEDYGDLLDFMQKLLVAEISGIDPKVISAVQETAGQVIIANRSTHTVNATGMSIWLPMDYPFYKIYKYDYLQLQFSINTQWGEMLGELLKSH